MLRLNKMKRNKENCVLYACRPAESFWFGLFKKKQLKSGSFNNKKKQN